jgi:hypothetical protein
MEDACSIRVAQYRVRANNRCHGGTLWTVAEWERYAFYVVIDVGKMGKKDEQLLKIKNNASKNGEPLSEIIFIDGTLKQSASRR